MKILLITDQHFGVRNDNLVFIEKYRQFYSNVVLPTIDKLGITEVIALGDTFDRRKGINFNSLDAAKEMWFTPLSERGVHLTMLVGNHDIYYKNTLRINAPDLLLGEYSNIDIVDDPQQRHIGDTDILLLPWICDANRERTRVETEKSSASICMGHLELNGFEALPGHRMEHGDDPSVYSKFDLVCSGHFHMKSRKGQINYLGNPYQLYWNDFGQKRGFHILNTDTKKLTFYRNPYDIFQKIYYHDDCLAEIKEMDLKGSYVKLVVEEKNDQVKFDQTIRYLQHCEAADLKIIEDTTYELGEDVDDVEVEDTLTILERCVAEMPNKDSIFGILKSLYVESLEV
jgi:DNA repair exonuclease SbcCD nuclease subunit